MRVLHGLSFDVEEFFHVANLRERFKRNDWADVPSRIESVRSTRLL